MRPSPHSSSEAPASLGAGADGAPPPLGEPDIGEPTPASSCEPTSTLGCGRGPGSSNEGGSGSGPRTTGEKTGSGPLQPATHEDSAMARANRLRDAAVTARRPGPSASPLPLGLNV